MFQVPVTWFKGSGFKGSEVKLQPKQGIYEDEI
jgi:hypothetical protein